LHVDEVHGISNGGLIAVQYLNAPYIYCLHKDTCPAGAEAIEVHDSWSAAHGNTNRVSCARECLRLL